MIQPLHDNVLIERDKPEDQTAGGLILPTTKHVEKPSIGTVIAVSKTAVDEDGNPRELSVSAGDRVLFGKYAGNEITVDGRPMIMMREKDLMAVLK